MTIFEVRMYDIWVCKLKGIHCAGFYALLRKAVLKSEVKKAVTMIIKGTQMLTLIRGGGDLASGIALRLHRSGLCIVITELPQPLTVRRLVSFAEAVPEGEWTVEGVTARRVDHPDAVPSILERGMIPVLVDPDLAFLSALNPQVVVDARMRKRPPEVGKEIAPLVIGLGPGFDAGLNCHAAIETNRGHNLGRVYWQGAPEADTGLPGEVMGYRSERVLRSPAEGFLQTHAEIGDLLEEGQIIAEVAGMMVKSPFLGALRGLLREGTKVKKGVKIGDVDPRGDPSYSRIVSDKARSLGGAVLEAILSRRELRPLLWN